MRDKISARDSINCKNCKAMYKFLNEFPCCECSRNPRTPGCKDYFEEPKIEDAFEMHFWLGDNYPDGCILSYASTNLAFKKRQPKIDTTQIHFFRGQSIDEGYRLFLHYPNGKIEEIAYGSHNISTGRELRPGHNLEKLLLNGEFDNIEYDSSPAKEN